MDKFNIYPIWVKFQEEGMIPAIKFARETYELPLITAKCLVEIVTIIGNELTCPQCRVAIEREDLKIPATIRIRRDG